MMAECGIEEYDELPGRVALIDVDYHRSVVDTLRNGSGFRYWLRRVQMALIYHRLRDDVIEAQALEDLEDARQIHTGEIQSEVRRQTNIACMLTTSSQSVRC